VTRPTPWHLPNPLPPTAHTPSHLTLSQLPPPTSLAAKVLRQATLESPATVNMFHKVRKRKHSNITGLVAPLRSWPEHAENKRALPLSDLRLPLHIRSPRPSILGPPQRVQVSAHIPLWVYIWELVQRFETRCLTPAYSVNLMG